MISPKVKTRIIIILCTILLLLASTMWYSINSIDQLQKNLDTQIHTRTIIFNLKNNLTNLLNAETGERGFVITGNEKYLEPYNRSIEEILVTRNTLIELTRNDKSIQPLMDSLNKYIDLKLNYIDNIISLKRAGKEEEVKDLLTTGEGKFFMDKIREYNLALQESKEMLFSERKNITYSSLKESRTIFIREGILAIIITIFLAITIVSELNRRMRTEAQLVIKNQELERKNNEIEQFAYISAHDLQEPLRSISNFSVLLKEKLQANTDPGTNRYMDKIIAAASRMSNLINDLLEYSRLGKDMERTKINTARLVDEVVHDIGIIIKESGAKITIEKLPVVVGHQSLKSLFQNLITNSIKFTAKGTRPEIKISSTQNQTEFVFSISDNGIGIDPQYFERIFTIFQRLHTREDYPGTGIGLAQCKKIVELHGGRIWVTSKPDNGSTFYFTISKNQKL